MQELKEHICTKPNGKSSTVKPAPAVEADAWLCFFCLYSNKSKLTCVVIGVEQQVQKNNSAANSNERVRLIPSGRY